MRECLTPAGAFCIVPFRFAIADTLKGSPERAMKMKLYSSYFAFTYRFLLWRKRAGETRAGELTD